MWRAVSFAATVAHVLGGPRIHPAYGLTWRKRLWLAWRMTRTARHVPTATSYRAHLAMAAKLFEIPPEVEGVVVECGSFRGGSTANLSLACRLVGRELIVYDSFEGLPEPTGNDRYANERQTGALRGSLDVVRANVAEHGAPERCSYRRGWFDQTLPNHTEPVVLAFLDVDYQASLDTCVRNLWPRLTDTGFMFIDEYILTDYCALFWSERYWREVFDRSPPGLIGAGSGVGLGHYYLGPARDWAPPQEASSIAYTRKDLSGHWDFDRAGPSPADPDPDAAFVEAIINKVDPRPADD